MAITTLNGVITGLRPPYLSAKQSSAGVFNNSPTALTSFYAAGAPVAATAPTPGVAGAALTSYTGQIPFPNPTSGNAYLARIESQNTEGNRSCLLIDRLWHNSGLNGTVITAQTVNSVAWPARDNNGSTNGEGVFIAVEFSAASGTGAPTVTMSYTNSSGTSGQSTTNVMTTFANTGAGRLYFMGLAAGDTGVRSIQSVTFSASWGASGGIHLVAYRPIALVNMASGVYPGTTTAADDALSLALPRMWNDSVPQVLYLLNSGFNPGTVSIQYTHG